MADQEEEDLLMAIRLSMQNSAPEPKRSKPRDAVGGSSFQDDSLQDSRKLQRELMAAAAEKRIMTRFGSQQAKEQHGGSSRLGVNNPHQNQGKGSTEMLTPRELSEEEGALLFAMLFGSSVSKDILNQWCNQGIRFSADPETSMGLVQHEGGPCGVLAAIQAFVIKHIIFLPKEVNKSVLSQSCRENQDTICNSIMCASKEDKLRALVKSMGEILFLCGNAGTAVIATLSDVNRPNNDSSIEDIIAESPSVESSQDLLKVIRVQTYTSQEQALRKLTEMIPVFQSRMGTLLFLISALLSRGLDVVQTDRDDPTFPLVTAPFGHASQEIVNLLLCGEAVPNVFDGKMDLGGGMFLKGISTNVEVGFLTLLESLNFCKVGQNLKKPKFPIWVVGSESHYTVLFALHVSVQDENELENRESEIRRAFDSHDSSGGGGFVSVESFHNVLKECKITLPSEKLDAISGSGFVVWSEFWQAILALDKSLGGLKDSSELMGKKIFDLYHFNGIAKSDLNGAHAANSVQKPRLTKLSVGVPPRWWPEEYMVTANVSEVSMAESSQHAPLVDCIRTRWPRAVCNWVGDPPSIV